MPIFSNRTIAALLTEISEKLSDERRNDILARLISGGDDAIAAEWEVAVFACLGRTGCLEFPPKRQGLSDPDVIYESRTSGERMLVEITAISDKGLRAKNAVHLFSEMLNGEARKLQSAVPGTFQFQLGYVKVNGKIVLGIPERREMNAFFKGREFRGFVRDITSNPGKPLQLHFECRGARSTLAFQPGAKFSGGGHIAHELILDIERNHISSRLESKHRQIKSADLGLPAIVILCDGGCRALSSTMFGPGAPTLNNVIDAFLNGNWFPQPGPPMRPKTSRINAVVIAAATERRDFSTSRTDRRVEVRYLCKRGGADYQLSDEAIDDLARALQLLPRPHIMPINARQDFKRPPFYGGGEIGSHNGRRAVKISLLTLQALLAGNLTQAEFARDHEIIAKVISKHTAEGRMISKMEVEKCPEDDDDWVRIEFDEISPKNLFQSLKG